MPETRTKTLDVTQEDIGNGERGSATDCPFALAAKRLFGTGNLSVTLGDIQVTEGSDKGYWTLDNNSTSVIIAYDDGGGMHPGQYTLTFNDPGNDDD